VTARPALVVVAAVAALVAACSGAGATPAAPPQPPRVRLTTVDGGRRPRPISWCSARRRSGALARQGSAAAANPGTTLTISTDSPRPWRLRSSRAPADVFLAAEAAPRGGSRTGLTLGDPVTFAGNRLGHRPGRQPAGIRTPADLARPGVKVIAAANRCRSPRTPPGWWTASPRETGYRPASPPPTPRTSSRGGQREGRRREGRLARATPASCITDAAASDAVAAVDVPDSANVEARYDGVVLRASRNPAAASAFLAWLVGPEGQAILARLGFLPPGP
jgi:molybdate transport system substrate-binding protein